MEFEDPFLHGVEGDQAVDNHRPGLTDPVGAIGCLILHGGVPPGVEQEDVVRRSEIQSGPARAQGDQHDRCPLGRVEAGDHPRPVPGGTVETFKSDPRRIQGGFDPVQERSPLGKNQGLVALFEGLAQAFHEKIHLGGSVRLLAGHKARMAGRLAQAQQGFQGFEYVSALAQTFDHSADTRGAHGVVDLALLGAEFAVENHLAARR